jgi:hypothetical protein
LTGPSGLLPNTKGNSMRARGNAVGEQPVNWSVNSKMDGIPNVFSLLRIEMSEAILGELIPVMNAIHSTNYSYRFWKIILGDYINAIISRRNELNEIVINQMPGWDAINSHSAPTLKQRIVADAKNLVKNLTSPNALSNCNQVLRKHDSITTGFPDIEMVSNELGQPLENYHPVPFANGDKSKRKKAEKLASAMTDVFFKNAINLLPIAYVEFFDKLMSAVQLVRPSDKTFHVHGPLSLFTKFVVSKYIENGAKLYWYQHGAYYGEFIGHNSHFYESSVADVYRTWGWKIKPNDEPWKAYRLEKFRKEYLKFPRQRHFDFLMCFPDVFDENLGFYETMTQYFLQNIDPTKYANLLARPRPLNKLRSHARKLSFINDKRVSIDSGLTSMAEVTSRCKLVVQFTVPSTNFLECFYVDHPTIGILANDQPTDAVRPYYDFLLKRGVLHREFASLVRHLNTVDIDQWWTETVHHPVYREFKNTFLRTP